MAASAHRVALTLTLTLALALVLALTLTLTLTRWLAAAPLACLCKYGLLAMQELPVLGRSEQAQLLEAQLALVRVRVS